MINNGSIFLLYTSTEIFLCKQEGIGKQNTLSNHNLTPFWSGLMLHGNMFASGWALQKEGQAGCILVWSSGHCTANCGQRPKKSIWSTLQNLLIQLMFFLHLRDFLPMEVIFSSVIGIFLKQAITMKFINQSSQAFWQQSASFHSCTLIQKNKKLKFQKQIKISSCQNSILFKKKLKWLLATTLLQSFFPLPYWIIWYWEHIYYHSQTKPRKISYNRFQNYPWTRSLKKQMRHWNALWI